MPAFYNEHDPYAAAWLGNLAATGHIAPGSVDTRSIVDLRPADVAGAVQFHAFAGIAGWSLALRLAGWPDDVPVWTGSCPCQPFSAAGRRAGFDDERHLWPAWFALIRECLPPVVFGEQVEAAVRLGWLDAVFADLEGEGYACAAVVLGAHSVGAPHIRQRLWFVAYAAEPGRGDAKDAGTDRGGSCPLQSRRQGQSGLRELERGGTAIRLADTAEPRRREQPIRNAGEVRRSASESGRLRHPDGLGLSPGRGRERFGSQPAHVEPLPASAGASPWSDLDWLPCRDGKARPTRPGLLPLAHGLSGRVGKLRAAGNAIVPQAAAVFIAAFMETPAFRDALLSIARSALLYARPDGASGRASA